MAKLFKQVQISEETTNLYQEKIVLAIKPNIDESQLQEAKFRAYELGKKEGLEKAQNQLNQLQKRLQDLLHSIPQALIQARLALQEEMVDIIWSIIQNFFIEKQDNKDALTLQINHILKLLNTNQSIELHLHPEDLKADLQLNASHLKSIQIKSNDTLRLGGCMIKTEHGFFDASIEQQVDKLKEKLLQLRQGISHAALD